MTFEERIDEIIELIILDNQKEDILELARNEKFHPPKYGDNWVLNHVVMKVISLSKDWRKSNKFESHYSQRDADELIGDAFKSAFAQDKLDPSYITQVLKDNSTVKSSDTVYHGQPLVFVPCNEDITIHLGLSTIYSRSAAVKHLGSNLTETMFGEKFDVEYLKALLNGNKASYNEHKVFENNFRDQYLNINVWLLESQISNTSKYEREMRANTVGRLVSEAIGLCLTDEDFKNLALPHENKSRILYDTYFRSQDGRLISQAHKSVNNGFFLGKQSIKQFATYVEKLNGYAGESLKTIALRDGEFFQISSNWCDAVSMFAAARRTYNSHIKLALYGSAADILTGGGKTKKILDLVCSIYKKSPDDKFLNDGTTFKQFVKKLYEHARSRTLHGNAPGQLSDEVLPFEAVDNIVRILIFEHLSGLSTYTGNDDPIEYLAHQISHYSTS